MNSSRTPWGWRTAIAVVGVAAGVVWMGDGNGWWNNLAVTSSRPAAAEAATTTTTAATSTTIPRPATTTTTAKPPTLWLQISGTTPTGMNAGEIPVATWEIWRNGTLYSSNPGPTPIPAGINLGRYNPNDHFIVNVIDYNTPSVTCLISIGSIEHSLQTAYGLDAQANCASG